MHFIPINYSDPDFNQFDLTQFLLLIILNQDNFSYAVRHPGTQKLIYVRTENPLSQLFEQNSNSEIWDKSFRKTIVAIQTNSFCLIPDAVFTEENLPDFAAFLQVKEADVILKDQLPNGENTVIFNFPGEITQKIKSRFGASEIVFSAKSWIKIVMENQFPGQNLYLYLEENQLHVLYPDHEKICFYNQFSCSTTDEVVYFTALAANQLQLNPAETSLVLCGRIAAQSEQMLRLQTFFKEVILFSTSDFEQKNVLQQHQIVQFLGLN